MSSLNSTADKSLFHYDIERIVSQTPDIELKVSSGDASIYEAHEVLMGYLDYIFKTLRAVDRAYMNRDGLLGYESQIDAVNDGVSKCLLVIGLAKDRLEHYPSLTNIIAGVYSSIRFQDIFTINAINSELNSGSLFDSSSKSIH